MKTFSIPYLVLRSATTPAVAASGELRMYYDPNLGVLMQSKSGSDYSPVGEGDVFITNGISIQSDGGLVLSDETSNAILNFSHRYRLTLDGTSVLVESAEADPNGIVNPENLILDFDDNNRIFTVNTDGNNVDFCVTGKAFTLSSPQTIEWPNTSGTHWFYFDADGYLATSSEEPENDFFYSFAPIAVIYWNQSTGSSIYRGDERHSSDMPGYVHAYLHHTRGAQWESGLALTNFSLDQDGSSNTHAQFGCEDGYFYDEDIRHSIIDTLPQNLSTELEAPTYYRIGQDWYSRPYDTSAIIWSDGYTFTGGSGLPAYNHYSAGNWSLSEVSNSDFFLLHVLATNNIDAPIICICGSNTYQNLNSARTAASLELIGLSNFPFAETLALGSIVFQARTTYANTVKARIRSMNDGSSYVDFRHKNIVAAGTIPSHSSLNGLTNQDHPASAIYTDTTGFDGYILTDIDTDVQTALDTIDTELTKANSISYVSYSAIVDLDFSGNQRIQISTLTGDIEFTTSNLSPAKGLTIRMTTDGTPRNLTFPVGWKFYTTAAPTTLAANTTAILAIECWGDSDSDVDAAWVVSV